MSPFLSSFPYLVQRAPPLLLSPSYGADEVQAERTMGPGLLTANEPKGKHCLVMALASCPNSYHLASSLELPLESQSEPDPIQPCHLLCMAGGVPDYLLAIWPFGARDFSGRAREL